MSYLSLYSILIRCWTLNVRCSRWFCPTLFFLKPEPATGPRRGILMVHGLTDSPFLMRDMADFFRDQGFHVLAMQLPGHGTRPGDLLAIRWQEWLKAQRHVLDLLSGEVDELYLLGFSTGATLNLYQALRDSRIRALFLFSPALRIRRMAQLACPFARFSRWLKRLAWFDVQPDSDTFKYESLSTRAICEVYLMTGALERLASLAELKIPVFVAASEDDVSIDSHAVLRWFERQQVTKRMLYYSQRPGAVPQGVRALSSRCTEHNIKSFSHISHIGFSLDLLD